MAQTEIKETDIKHHPNCQPPYHYQTVPMDGFKAIICQECGDYVSDLPPIDDPYWDDIREEMQL